MPVFFYPFAVAVFCLVLYSFYFFALCEYCTPVDYQRLTVNKHHLAPECTFELSHFFPTSRTLTTKRLLNKHDAHFVQIYKRNSTLPPCHSFSLFNCHVHTEFHSHSFFSICSTPSLWWVVLNICVLEQNKRQFLGGWCFPQSFL